MLRHLAQRGAHDLAVLCSAALRSSGSSGLLNSSTLKCASVSILGALNVLRRYSQPTFPYSNLKHNRLFVHKGGVDILHDPVTNKGTSFTRDERERLGLRGLLPPRISSMEQQLLRVNDEYLYGKNYIDPAHADVTPEDVRKWRTLIGLQDRNETLFYRHLMNNFVDAAPIIYTPTVGWACLNFSRLYHRPRGMFFSSQDRGHMHAMTWNWPGKDVDAIVVTDGSRILGLGDLGCNGLGISIGKLDLYVAGAGFRPSRILPCVVDVGTNNMTLRNDPLYIGLDQPRLEGDQYYEVLDEFVGAVMDRWPKAVLQFEDFSTDKALTLLNRYREHHCVFNDDIQGTACTALAGMYGALQAQGLPNHALPDQRVVVLGAGSAGMGVVELIAYGMMEQKILSFEEAATRFWMIDQKGLITKSRGSVLTPEVQPFARYDPDDMEGERLLDVIKRVKPTILIGLAGAGRLFTDDVLKAMNDVNPDQRPIIFPMSNPTSKMECTHVDAQRATGGRAIFASGSPQPDVEWDGKLLPSSQANNMYIFPGLAFGAHLGESGTISDRMLMTAAETLPTTITQEDSKAGRVYPRLERIRDISLVIAREVMKTAFEEGHLHNDVAMREMARGDSALDSYIRDSMYNPEYGTIIKLPRGVEE